MADANSSDEDLPVLQAGSGKAAPAPAAAAAAAATPIGEQPSTGPQTRQSAAASREGTEEPEGGGEAAGGAAPATRRGRHGGRQSAGQPAPRKQQRIIDTTRPPPATTDIIPWNSPQELVGKQVTVWYEVGEDEDTGKKEGEFYTGKVLSYDPATRKHIVDFPDEEGLVDHELADEDAVLWNPRKADKTWPWKHGAIVTSKGAKYRSQEPAAAEATVAPAEAPGSAAAEEASPAVAQQGRGGRRSRGAGAASPTVGSAAGGLRRQRSGRGSRQQAEAAAEENGQQQAQQQAHQQEQQPVPAAAAAPEAGEVGEAAAAAAPPAVSEAEDEAQLDALLGSVAATAQAVAAEAAAADASEHQHQQAPPAGALSGGSQGSRPGPRSVAGMRSKFIAMVKGPTSTGGAEAVQPQHDAGAAAAEEVALHEEQAAMVPPAEPPAEAAPAAAEEGPAVAVAAPAAVQEPAAEKAEAEAMEVDAAAPEAAAPQAAAPPAPEPAVAVEAAPVAELAAAVPAAPVAVSHQRHKRMMRGHSVELAEGAGLEAGAATATEAGAAAVAVAAAAPGPAKRRRVQNAAAAPSPSEAAQAPQERGRGGRRRSSSTGGKGAGTAAAAAAEQVRSSPAEAAPTAAPAAASPAAKRQRGAPADLPTHPDPVVQDLLQDRQHFLQLREQYEAGLKQAEQASEGMLELFQRLSTKPITLEQLRQVVLPGGAQIGKLVNIFDKVAAPLWQRFKATHDSSVEASKQLVAGWRQLKEGGPAAAPAALVPPPTAGTSVPGKRPPQPPQQQRRPQQQQQQQQQQAAPPVSAASALLEELTGGSQLQAPLLAGKRERSSELPLSQQLTPAPSAVAPAPAAAAEEVKEEPAGPVLPFESTGDSLRDAAVQVLLLALCTERTPLQVAVELEQQLFEDFKEPDSTVAGRYLRTVHRVYQHLSPESEEHRSLLAYLMLTGLERPADVARFTAEDVRASEAKALQCMGHGAKSSPLQEAIDALAPAPAPAPMPGGSSMPAGAIGAPPQADPDMAQVLAAAQAAAAKVNASHGYAAAGQPMLSLPTVAGVALPPPPPQVLPGQSGEAAPPLPPVTHHAEEMDLEA